MIGAKADAIERGEDRERFKELMLEIGLDVPVSGIAHNMDDAWAIADRIGKFPLIIRPAYTLGGTGGGIAYNRDEYEELTKKGINLSPVNEILVEEWVDYSSTRNSGPFLDEEWSTISCRRKCDHSSSRKGRPFLVEDWSTIPRRKWPTIPRRGMVDHPPARTGRPVLDEDWVDTISSRLGLPHPRRD